MKTFNNSNPSGNSPSPEDYLKTSEDYLKKELTPAEEAGMFNNGPDSPEETISNNAVKGGAWLLGILAVFGVALLICWIIDINHSPSSSYASRATSERTVISKPGVPVIDATTGQQFMAKVNQATAKAAADNAKAVATVKTIVKKISKSASDAVSSTDAAAVSQADKDRIEKEALEVIHGDFGNNPGRAQKLGADYAAVQARVNQLLHS